MRLCRPLLAIAAILLATPCVAEDRQPIDVDMFAVMSGKCSTLRIAGRDFRCTSIAFFHDQRGRARFTIALNDPGDTSHVVAFSGESAQREQENLYELRIDRMPLNSKDRPKVDGLPVPSAEASAGICRQFGNFATRQIASVSCSATDQKGRKYELQFESDGSPIRVQKIRQGRFERGRAPRQAIGEADRAAQMPPQGPCRGRPAAGPHRLHHPLPRGVAGPSKTSRSGEIDEANGGGMMNSFEPQAPLLLLPLPVLHGERVGVRGRLANSRDESMRRLPLTRRFAPTSPRTRGEVNKSAHRFPVTPKTPHACRATFLPLPVLHGERVGVRGCLRIRESNSRRLPLTRRFAPTSPRTRGEMNSPHTDFQQLPTEGLTCPHRSIPSLKRSFRCCRCATPR